MNKYEKEILTKMIDTYERREAFKKTDNRIIQEKIDKLFPAYGDKYDHKTYVEIDTAIENLCSRKFIERSDKSDKVKLVWEAVDEIYVYLKRVPIYEQSKELLDVLKEFDEQRYPLNKIVSDFIGYVSEDKKIPYDIGYDKGKLSGILTAIQKILELTDETYIRNFSNALYKNSKTFQKQYRSIVESVLFDYTETTVDKKQILNVYNLYDNPTYIYMKGNAIIYTENSTINLTDFPYGISLPEKSLKAINNIKCLANKVITVENLTTYHDCRDYDALYIYLGGFHNHSKERVLKIVYKYNSECRYYHKGDIDVFGFAILESLKERTGIPFEPLQMDINTLKKYYEAGLYQELSPIDKKKMQSHNLRQYQGIFTFMLEHNCKVEQEAIEAIGLLND